MLKTFWVSFRLRAAYKTNGIIFVLKSLPLIKKLLPASLYASPGLKAFANAVGILIEIGSVFFGKALYLLGMIAGPIWLIEAFPKESFLHIFFFLTLCGGFMTPMYSIPPRTNIMRFFCFAWRRAAIRFPITCIFC